MARTKYTSTKRRDMVGCADLEEGHVYRLRQQTTVSTVAPISAKMLAGYVLLSISVFGPHETLFSDSGLEFEKPPCY